MLAYREKIERKEDVPDWKARYILFFLSSALLPVLHTTS